MKNKKYIELCKGCYSEVNGICAILTNGPNRVKDCPCQLCIVKSMCEVICNKRKALYIELFGG